MTVNTEIVDNLQYYDQTRTTGRTGRSIVNAINNEQLLINNEQFRESYAEFNQSRRTVGSNLDANHFLMTGQARSNRVNLNNMPRAELIRLVGRLTGNNFGNDPEDIEEDEVDEQEAVEDRDNLEVVQRVVFALNGIGMVDLANFNLRLRS